MPIAINAEQKASPVLVFTGNKEGAFPFAFDPCHPPKKGRDQVFRDIKGSKEAALLSLEHKEKGRALLFLVVKKER